jgi:putative addiction module killer protein
LKVIIYEDEQQFRPFDYWILSLRDKVLKQRILARIDRLYERNFGDHKYIDDGVWEMRMTFGGGIRIYYGIHKDEIVLLLNGGDKSTQQRDIKKAILFWQKYLETSK